MDPLNTMREQDQEVDQVRDGTKSTGLKWMGMAKIEKTARDEGC